MLNVLMLLSLYSTLQLACIFDAVRHLSLSGTGELSLGGCATTLRRTAEIAPRITPGANCVYSMYAKYKLLCLLSLLFLFALVCVLSCVGDGRTGRIGGGEMPTSQVTR